MDNKEYLKNFSDDVDSVSGDDLAMLKKWTVEKWDKMTREEKDEFNRKLLELLDKGGVA